LVDVQAQKQLFRAAFFASEAFGENDYFDKRSGKPITLPGAS